MDNEFLDQVDEDLNDKSHEPATGWKFFAATTGSMAAMFIVCGVFITSSMK